jgi:hypothetical protein
MVTGIPFLVLLSLLPLAGTTAVAHQPAAVENAVEAPSGDQSSGEPRPIPAASRGQLFYENHCLACHESVVHIREHHKVRTMDDLRAWVVLWAEELHLNWGPPEVEEVMRHLNRRYYHFDER